MANDIALRIRDALMTVRVPAVPSEYDIHALAARALEEAGIVFSHEERLGPGCRVDFFADGVAIEIKKGKPVQARLLEQAKKYLACEQVRALVIVSQKRVSLPASICGKPVYVLCLDRLWGISLP